MMRFNSALLCIFSAFAGTIAQAQVASPAEPVSTECIRLNENALARVAQGRSKEAETTLSAALSNDGLTQVCTGLIMSNLAALLSASGRVAEAEMMAKRSVHALEDNVPPDDPALLRPLQILAAAQFELGRTGRARGFLKRMQSIRTTRPEDRALVCALAAPLLEAEGKWPEAESQYYAAVQFLKEAGHGDGADSAALLNAIGSLYIKEHRLRDAGKVLNEAFAILERAPDATPWDRINLLRVRGALYARQGEWTQAEQDFANALSTAEAEPQVDPTILKSMLIDYATVLKKVHRQREAQTIARRAATLRSAPEDGNVVDVADLLAGKRSQK
jgi:tetratricopeptide (TPR) repeat protein